MPPCRLGPRTAELGHPCCPDVLVALLERRLLTAEGWFHCPLVWPYIYTTDQVLCLASL